ncbi:caspase family protein [Arthrobacter sp. FX8]|uniref:caspase family protein n=1 Tax=Arthrobacter sp. FX8 TaxID=2997335 RepID=UPI00227C7289|nr:caspase family protein [Arthrobacter sp. FX8]WAJ34398.1 caspase family protein [Arthrobacter sp. FX8]
MNLYHYAVVVGISRYPGVGNLEGPLVDAADFCDWLTTDGGVSLENMRVAKSPDIAIAMDSPYDGRPIKREIDRLLEMTNEKASDDIGSVKERRAQSRLYLYVAGHGIMPSGGECALLLADARRGMYENFELGVYADWYKKSGIFSELVIFADCCRNWFPQVPRSVVPFDDPAELGSRVYSLMGYAAGPGDPAYESVEAGVPADERRGYFTKAVLQGLRGAASIDPDYQAISSTTLTRYVNLAVQQSTAGKRIQQRVQMPEEPARPILFPSRQSSAVALQRPHKYEIRLRFPAGWSEPVELLTNGGERLRYEGAPTPWVLSLPPGLYGVYIPGTWDTSGLAHPEFTVTGARDVQL